MKISMISTETEFGYRTKLDVDGEHLITVNQMDTVVVFFKDAPVRKYKQGDVFFFGDAAGVEIQ